MKKSTLGTVLGIAVGLAIASYAMAQTPSSNVFNTTPPSTTGEGTGANVAASSSGSSTVTATTTNSVATTTATTTESIYNSNTMSALVATPPQASTPTVPVLTSGAMGVTHKAATVLMISASRHALMRGIVESIGTSTMTVLTWGGPWTVSISGTTMFGATALAVIEPNDFVGVLGTVSQTMPYTIDATRVRDWSK